MSAARRAVVAGVVRTGTGGDAAREVVVAAAAIDLGDRAASKGREHVPHRREQERAAMDVQGHVLLLPHVHRLVVAVLEAAGVCQEGVGDHLRRLQRDVLHLDVAREQARRARRLVAREVEAGYQRAIGADSEWVRDVYVPALGRTVRRRRRGAPRRR